ncbi:ABC transporter substrate-binding protein [Cohnella thailandensis]|uniref:Extracellular solute-binding protein n=1 Tax=Cohnella thailandensis TaxID=557557 RepID=A0A841T5E9_9BACL|nr:extracellular solute-binding protein [Cohnella thailandensis]MBB6636361.1 extracellular solute-binding protein [Cohnella thailandensis]MBP1973669.1 multiple sugar transport system substrate-binding protein [Cohnella thailandensis]
MNTKKKSIAATLSIAMLVPLVAACSSDSSDDPNNRRTLRIGMLYGSPDNETYFRQQYTDMFEMTHNNIDIEIVNAYDWSEMQYATEEERKENPQPEPMELYKKLMTGDNPVDVIMLDSGSMIGDLVEANMVKPLDPLLKKDKIDLADYVPSVIDYIREQGNGQIYGLTPTFSSSALFYNKKLFTDKGITPPTDDMTWDQVFALARQVTSGTGKDAIFGFSFNDWNSGLNFYNVQNIVAPLQLRTFDTQGEKMTVNTPQWEKAWAEPIQLYKDRVIPKVEDFQQEQPMDGNYRYDPYEQRPFFSGRLAMMIGSYNLVNELDAFNRNVSKMKDYKAIEWGVVTYPQLSEMPGVGGNMYLNQLVGINATAPNEKDAWEFIKFINGKENAKFKARSQYELSTLQEFVKPKEGATFNMEAFTKLKPVSYESSDADTQLYKDRPNLNLLYNLSEQAFQKALSGDMSVKEALADWQAKGDELLQKIKANPTGEIDMTPYMDPNAMDQKNAIMAAAGMAVAG